MNIISRTLKFFVFAQLVLATFWQINAQSRMTVIGDSLVGKTIAGEKVREVIGNVIIKDDKAVITCDRAIQFLESGNIKLNGNVIFRQDTIRLFTERAQYFADSEIGIIDTSLLMFTNTDTITAASGKYLFENQTAFFYGKAKANSLNKKLLADTIIYYKPEEKLFAYGNVAVFDSLSELHSDTLFYWKKNEITKAKGNVYIKSFEQNTESVCGIMIDSAKALHTILFEKPVVVKIDISENKADTLTVLAERFDFFRRSSNVMIARDSVKLVRNDFSLVCDSAYFNSSEESFTAVKKSDGKLPVILWFEKSQIYGDTVYVWLKENEINKVKITGNVMMIEEVNAAKNRYNQISGKIMRLYFRGGSLAKMETEGKTLDIYYLSENEGTQGLIKSSSSRAVIEFDSSGVAKVKLFGNPDSEFHPEKLIAGKERDFLLPGFRLYFVRPEKIQLLRKLFNNPYKTIAR